MSVSVCVCWEGGGVRNKCRGDGGCEEWGVDGG